MYNNTENRGQLDRALELERALARHQWQQWRQQRRQQIDGYIKRLHAFLMQPWLWRRWRPRLATIRNT